MHRATEACEGTSTNKYYAAQTKTISLLERRWMFSNYAYIICHLQMTYNYLYHMTFVTNRTSCMNLPSNKLQLVIIKCYCNLE